MNKCVIGFLLIFATTTFASKPSSPINIELSNLSKGAVSEITIAVTVTSRIDIEKADVEVTIKGDAEVISGELSWKGPIKKGTPIVRFLNLKTQEGMDQLQLLAEIKGVNQGMNHPFFDVSSIEVISNKASLDKRYVHSPHSIIEYQTQ